MNLISTAVNLLSVLILSKVAMVIGMSLQDWKNMGCPEDTLKCLDGSCCKYGEKYCSDKSDTCEPVFPTKLDLDMAGKLSYCCTNFNITSVQQLRTACNYLFGKYNLPKKCNENKELIPTSISEPVLSKSTIVPWCMFGIALFCMLILSVFVVYFYRQIKKPKPVNNGIKASPKDKNLSLQKRLSLEQTSPLDIEAHTQMELLLNKSNSSFDATVETRDESRVNHTPRSVIDRDESMVNHAPQNEARNENRVNYTPESPDAVDDRRVDYPPPVSEGNQVHTPPHMTGVMKLIPLIISPSDNHGNTLVTPSGEHYKG